jgi:hypothetical protein
MKKTAPALALKGSGMGHAFSIIILNHRTSTWPGVLNLEGKNSQFYCDQIIDQVHTQMLEKPARTVKNIPCGPVQIKVRLNTPQDPLLVQGARADKRSLLGGNALISAIHLRRHREHKHSYILGGKASPLPFQHPGIRN